MNWVRDPKRPRYFISIAAELAAVHPRTLRIYEEEGLVCPQRRNNLRLYSEADLERVRIIRFLTRRQGVNLAGVKVILQLEALGKIRVYDLFDEADVERYLQGEPESETELPPSPRPSRSPSPAAGEPRVRRPDQRSPSPT